jgi:hypothetical protein
VALQPQFNPQTGIVASAEAIPWRLLLGCSETWGYWAIPPFFTGTRKKNRKAHDNSRIICAKLKFFYLCDGYDWEIRITI